MRLLFLRPAMFLYGPPSPGISLPVLLQMRKPEKPPNLWGMQKANACHSMRKLSEPKGKEKINEKRKRRKRKDCLNGLNGISPCQRVQMMAPITVECAAKIRTRLHSVHIVDDFVIRVEVQAIVVVVGNRDIVLEIVGQLRRLLASRLARTKSTPNLLHAELEIK
jgi:hypothetical protein